MGNTALSDMYYNTSEACWFWSSNDKNYPIQPGDLLPLYIKRWSKTITMLCEMQVDGNEWYIRVGENVFILHPSNVYTLVNMG